MVGRGVPMPMPTSGQTPNEVEVMGPRAREAAELGTVSVVA